MDNLLSSAVVAATISALVTWFVKTRELPAQRLLEAQKIRHAAMIEYEKQVRAKIEEACSILQRIRFQHSQTATFMRRREQISEVEYHKRYLEQGLPDEQRLHAIVTAWFPVAREKVFDIDSCANRFWGQQQHLLYLDQEKKDDRRVTLDKLTVLASEMNDHTQELEALLTERARALEYG